MRQDEQHGSPAAGRRHPRGIRSPGRHCHTDVWHRHHGVKATSWSKQPPTVRGATFAGARRQDDRHAHRTRTPTSADAPTSRRAETSGGSTSRLRRPQPSACRRRRPDVGTTRVFSRPASDCDGAIGARHGSLSAMPRWPSTLSLAAVSLPAPCAPHASVRRPPSRFSMARRALSTS